MGIERDATDQSLAEERRASEDNETEFAEAMEDKNEQIAILTAQVSQLQNLLNELHVGVAELKELVERLT